MTGELLVETRGSVRWLTLNRPECLNSLNLALVRALDAALDRLPPEITAVVVTGAGRAFCAGGDLDEFESPTGFRTGAPLFGAISAMLSRLEALPIPVIGAINGLAVAGGLEIALACDLVVACASAQFGDGHARYGLLPGGGGSVRLPRKIGVNRAKYLMMTARMVPASTMVEWGLVNEIAAPEKLIDTVDRLTTDLAKKSPLGLRRMKELVDHGLTLSVPEALANEHAVCARHDESFDRNEGLAAFTEKRIPNFLGK